MEKHENAKNHVNDLINKGWIIKSIEMYKFKYYIQAVKKQFGMTYFLEKTMRYNGKCIYFREWTNDYLKGVENEGC